MLTRFIKIMLLVNIHVSSEKTRKVNYDAEGLKERDSNSRSLL